MKLVLKTLGLFTLVFTAKAQAQSPVPKSLVCQGITININVGAHNSEQMATILKSLRPMLESYGAYVSPMHSPDHSLQAPENNLPRRPWRHRIDFNPADHDCAKFLATSMLRYEPDQKKQPRVGNFRPPGSILMWWDQPLPNRE